MQGKVYIGGSIVEPADAKISIFDRGFLYGDSVFETMRVHEGHPFALEAHLERLFASGRLVGFALPWAVETLRDAITETVAAAGMPSMYLRVIATRGVGSLGLDPVLASDPQLLILALPLPNLPETLYTQGVHASMVSVRRNPKKTVDPRAKTGNYLGNILAVGEAKRGGFDEAIMLDQEGRVAEASAANVFARLDGVWCTPSLDMGILSGITRGTLLRLCKESGIPAKETVLWPDDLARADEIFFSASVREVIPVTSLDGKPVGTGGVGAGTRDLMTRYRAEVSAYLERLKIAT